MQKPQTFIEQFMTDASQFGLHLDATADTSPFKSIEGEICVSRVIDLRDTFVFVMATKQILVIDGSIGMSVPNLWTSKVVSTVEELADFIKLRRAVQNGRWN